MPVPIHKPRVKEVASNKPNGATAFNLPDSAPTGFQSFDTAYASADTCPYFATNPGGAWESGIGTFTAGSPDTLARSLIASSTGSLIDWSAGGDVTVSVQWSASNGNRTEIALQAITPGGRLTLESGVPVSTTDQSAKTSIYYTPFVHNIINLWDGAAWQATEFTEKTLALGTLTSGKPYDVFGYLSAGQLVLEALAWTSDTARATAVTLQDGRYCKSGDKTRLLLGSFYTTSTTTTEDSQAKRYLSNVYNRANKVIKDTNSTGHTYTTGSWREWNAGTGVTRIQFLSCLQLSSLSISLIVNLQITGAGTAGYCNVDYDSTTGAGNLLTNLENYLGATGSSSMSGTAIISAPLGKHYATCIEYGSSGVTYAAMTLYGGVSC